MSQSSDGLLPTGLGSGVLLRADIIMSLANYPVQTVIDLQARPSPCHPVAARRFARCAAPHNPGIPVPPAAH